MLSNEPFYLKHDHSDRVCLLLHGLGGGPFEMQRLGEYLYDRGISVLSLAYPGHDVPQAKMPDSFWEQWYEKIETTYQTLAAEYKTIDVIGFSTGCPLGIELTLNYPISKLILLAPFLAIKHRWYYLQRPEFYVNLLSPILREVPRGGKPIFEPTMRQQAEEVAYYKTFNLIAVKSALTLIQKIKPRLGKIINPTLIIQSTLDSVVDPAGAQYIYDHIGTDHKQLCWLERSDHIITMDSEYEQVFQWCGDFLDREGIALDRE
jgi:carboxylesterase